MQKEPLLTIGTITAAVTAIIGLLTAFGLDLSEDQQTAILGVVAVAAPFIVAGVARGRVWSPAGHERETAISYEAGRASATRTRIAPDR